MIAPVVKTDDAVVEFNCEQTVRRLWDYLDGQLEVVDVAAVDAHLAACDECPNHFTFEQRFLKSVREARSAMPLATPESLERLRARVVEALSDAGALRSPELDQ